MRTPVTAAPVRPTIEIARRSALSSLPRTLLTVVAVLVVFYALAVGAAYSWLHFARNSHVGVADVALFNMQRVRQAMAREQFDEARADLAAKNYRGAYVAFSSALRRDPDNVAGRIDAAAFFGAVGSTKIRISVLEEGLTRAPEDLQLANLTLSLLTSTGRDHVALELIRKLYGEQATGRNAAMVETYRILATINSGDADGARRLLEQHPEIRTSREALPALAMVLWQLKERGPAIKVLSGLVDGGSAAMADYTQLARWQVAGGLADDAISTARRARAAFPGEKASQLLLIETLADQALSGDEVRTEIESYLKGSSATPEAILALGELAGRKGWLDLARNLYVASSDHLPNLRMLALYYADALAVNSHLDDEEKVLKEIEVQSADAGGYFGIELRRRQVFVAATRGDTEAVREDARELAADLQGSDPDNFENYHRLFTRMGLKEAAAAFDQR
jgi:tetratricopeptide (TPR) repeat protein